MLPSLPKCPQCFYVGLLFYPPSSEGLTRQVLLHFRQKAKVGLRSNDDMTKGLKRYSGILTRKIVIYDIVGPPKPRAKSPPMPVYFASTLTLNQAIFIGPIYYIYCKFSLPQLKCNFFYQNLSFPDDITHLSRSCFMHISATFAEYARLKNCFYQTSIKSTLNKTSAIRSVVQKKKC